MAIGPEGKQGRAKILTRINRLEDGNLGKPRNVGGGVVEMKIDFGPGYRVSYTQRGPIVVLLLCGGDKHTHQNDIVRAKALADVWGNENDE